MFGCMLDTCLKKDATPTTGAEPGEGEEGTHERLGELDMLDEALRGDLQVWLGLKARVAWDPAFASFA